MPAFGRKLISAPSSAVGPTNPQLTGCLAWCYPEHNRTNDLIAGYPLSELGGVQFSTNYQGRPAWYCTAANTGQRVTIATRALDGEYNVLVTAWVFINTSSTNRTSERVFSKGVNDLDWYFNVGSVVNAVVYIKSSSQEFQVSKTVDGVITRGGWFYFASILEKGTSSVFYYNDAYISRVTNQTVVSRQPNDGVDWTLLARADAARSLRGGMSEFRVYDLDNIDYGTYPTPTDLIEDIRDNPDVGLP